MNIYIKISNDAHAIILLKFFIDYFMKETKNINYNEHYKYTVLKVLKDDYYELVLRQDKRFICMLVESVGPIFSANRKNIHFAYLNNFKGYEELNADIDTIKKDPKVLLGYLKLINF